MGLPILFEREHPLVRRQYDTGYFPPRSVEFEDVFTGRIEEYKESVTDRIEVFLTHEHPSTDLIYQLDVDLHNLSMLYGRAENDGWSECVKSLLPESYTKAFPSYVNRWIDAHIQPHSYDFGDLQSRELDLIFSILNAHANYALFRTYEFSKRSAIDLRNSQEPTALVGAMAFDLWGNMIGLASKDTAHPDYHAEELLIAQLRDNGLLKQTFLVTSSLEPCDKRSQAHQDTGHQDSCSELIVKAKVPAVGYILLDNNPNGRGQGLQRLIDAGVAVFPAMNPFVIMEIAQMQSHQHFHNTTAQIRRFEDII